MVTCGGTITSFASSTTHIEGMAILTLTKQAPQSATSGSIINYILEYRNIGTSKANDVILMDYYPAGFMPIPNVPNPIIFNIGTLNPGDFGIWTITGTITSPSNATLTNCAIIVGNTTCPDGSVSASASATTYVFGLPDLVVRNITLSPGDTVNEGTWVWLLAEIANIGNKEARNASVSFFLENSQIGSTRTIAYIGAGQTRYAGITWKASPSGTYTINTIADLKNNIPEIREDNNIGTKTIIILSLPNKGNISGRIRDARRGSPPISGAYIFCFGPTSGMAISDINGTYTISNLNPGSYRVLAYKSGYTPQSKNCSVLEGQTTIVNFLLTSPRTLADDSLLSEFINLLGNEYDARIAFSIISSITDPYEIPIDPQPARFSLSKENDDIIISINKDICGAKIILDYDKEIMKITEIVPIQNLYLWIENDTLCITGQIKKGQIARIKASYDNDTSLTLSPISAMNILNEEEEAKGDSINIEARIDTKLLQNFPNPARGSAWIPFKLSSDAYVSLVIYNVLGQKVKTIEIGQRKKGSYTKAQEGSAIFFDGRNSNGEPLSSGLYYYKLQAGKFSDTKAMVIK